MLRMILATIVGLSLSGCGLVARQQQQEQLARVKQQAAEAKQDCESRFPTSPKKNHVEQAKCLNAFNESVVKPTSPFPDLIDLLDATRLSLATKVDQGTMSEADANLQLAQTRTHIVQEADRRQLAVRSVNAQETAAAASAAGTTCIKNGNTVSCF